ncbi:MAG: hypothetical protein H0U86_02380 [Chloroflexi bacterium]|nr:hypothetical protein [Chloroflexota bacterium]
MPTDDARSQIALPAQGALSTDETRELGRLVIAGALLVLVFAVAGAGLVV